MNQHNYNSNNKKLIPFKNMENKKIITFNNCKQLKKLISPFKKLFYQEVQLQNLQLVKINNKLKIDHKCMLLLIFQSIFFQKQLLQQWNYHLRINYK